MLARMPALQGTAMTALELMQKRIRERLAKTGLSANAAGRSAGLGLSYVNDLLSGKSKKPVPHRLAQLAQVLDCDVEYLLGEQDHPRSHVRLVSDNTPKDPGPGSSVQLYNVGLPDADGFFRLTSEAFEAITLGSMLTAAGAYAIVVPDDANAPRYFAGEVVVTNPARPVSRGGFAVIRMRDGRASIRRVDSILGDKVVVTSISDGVTVEIPRQDVEAVHKIVGTAELTR